MEFTTLGNSGLKVSKIILGAMSYGSKKWQSWILDDEEEVFALLKASYDAGIRTWDTANVYSNGVSETLIGKFLKKYNIPRSTVVILSKCFGKCDDDPAVEASDLNWINRHGLSRKHIIDAVEASTKRLGTYIDVLQIHRFDHNTPEAETMEALHDVVKSGKVRYIGASSMRATEFASLQFTAEKNGWTKFISMQNRYSLIHREEEREMNVFCKKTNVGLIPWGPVAAGLLCRPASGGPKTDRAKTLEGERDDDVQIIKRVEELAKKHNVSMATVALAWILEKGTMPIVGLSTVARIEEAVNSLKLKLTEEEVKYLEEPYTPHLVTGF